MPSAVRIIDRFDALSDVLPPFAPQDLIGYDGTHFVPAQRITAAELADTTDPAAGDALIGVKRTASGAAGHTLDDRVDYSRFNIKADFGAVGDGVTDDLPAFEAAMAAQNLPNDSTGRIIEIPYGVYRLSAPFHLRRQCILRGESGAGWSAGSVLLVDGGQHGIIVDRWNTAPGGGEGDWSVIENLAIKAAAKTGTAHGIWMKARAEVRNCYIYNFSGDGIRISGTSGLNANNWVLRNLFLRQCGGNGLFIEGNDANAGYASEVWGSQNAYYGIKDLSGLGNTYVACGTEGNGNESQGGGFYVDNNDPTTGSSVNASLLLGCYTEAGQRGSHVARPAVVIGGTQGAGFAATGSAPVLDTDASPYQGCLRVTNAVEARDTKSPNGVQSWLATGDGTDTAQMFAASGSGVWRLKWDSGLSSWHWYENNLDAGRALSFRPGGNIGFPNGFSIGIGGLLRSVSLAASQPGVGGTTGDIALRVTPLDGAGIGWICLGGSVWAEWGQASTGGASLWGRDALAGVLTPNTATDYVGFGVVDSFQPRLARNGDDLLQVLGAVAIETRGWYGGATDRGPTLSVGNALAGHTYVRVLGHWGAGDTFVVYTADDSLTGSAQGEFGIRSEEDPLIFGVATTLVGRVVITPDAQLQITGSGRFTGNFDQTSATAGVYVGVATADSPRLLFANGTPAQNWQIDNSSGTFRWFLPGVVHMSLDSAKLSLPSKHLALSSIAAPAAPASGRLLYSRSSDGHMVAKDSGGVEHDLEAAFAATVLTGSVAWDPPSLAHGQLATTTVTVTGAVLGDTVNVSFSLLLPDGVQFAQAQVSAANTVTATLINLSGSTQNVGTGTLRAVVWQV